MQPRIPKLRRGGYFSPFLEARKTPERALVAVIQEAWIGGVSTRRADELVQVMGLSGIGKGTASKLCKDITQPGTGSPQPSNVHTGTLHRTIEPKPTGRCSHLRPRRIPVSSRLMLAVLIFSSLAR